MSKSGSYAHSYSNVKLKLLSTLILSALAGSAYAGGCTPISTNSYICSGMGTRGTDVTQSLINRSLEGVIITTDPGFGINTNAKEAFYIGGQGNLSFTDNNGSIITGATTGIDFAAGGEISIITSGTVTGVTEHGIYGVAATNVIIDANNVFGNQYGIYIINRAAYIGRLLSITTIGTVSGTNRSGIYAESYGELADAGINIQAYDVFGGSNGIESINRGLGNTVITSSGSVNGTLNTGIYAFNSANSSDLIIQALNVSGGIHGIYAENNGDGATSITATGIVIGRDGDGIFAENSESSTDLTILATGDVSGLSGIQVADYGTGAVSITTTGMVMGSVDNGITVQNSVSGTNVTIQATNVSGGKSGIYAENNGIGMLSITTSGTVVGATEYGINAYNQGNGPVSLTVNSDSTVQGAVAGITIDSTTPSDITNLGTIRHLSGLSSDIAIQTTGTQTSSTITNQGLLLGTVALSDSGNSLVNNGTWETAGGTNDFGALETSNSLVNNGTIIAADGAVPAAQQATTFSSTLQTTSDIPQTTTFNHIGAFTNAGILTMANDRVGDITVISGNYVGNGGNVLFDTVLGNDGSATDKLVINGNTSGTTYVGVNNLGGSGAQTVEGIQLVQVNGVSEGQFANAGRIVAGAYDYSVVRGTGANAGNWYLSNRVQQEDTTDSINSTDSTDPINSTDPIEPVRAINIRPEAGAYTANLAAVNTLFVTRLHDRLGETQYIDALTGEKKITSLWLRNEGGHNRFRDASDILRTQSNRYVLQLGGDIAQWSNNGSDRLHLGLMGGYGDSKSNTVSRLSGYDAKGAVDGYSVGAYATWYANAADKSGLYMDGWLQYGWFNNSVTGQGLASETYKSKGFSASVESGYTFKLGESVANNVAYFIQPKAQLTWMGIKADDHREVNGSHIKGEGDGNLQTRLGVKAFINGYNDQDKGKDRVFQPFVEANWLHNSKDFGIDMDGMSVKQDGAANIAELKLGVEGQLNKQVNLWGNVAQQVGNKGYSDTAVMLGVKYNF